MKHDRKKKKLIILFLVIGIFSLSIGFANFSSLLKIDSSADVDPNPENFKVVFASEVLEDGSYLQDNIHPISSTGDLETYDGEIVDNTSLNNLGGVFTEDGQSITYDLLLYNPGKYDAYLTNVIYSFYDGTHRQRECANISSSDETYSNSCDDIQIKLYINEEEYLISSEISNKVLKKGEQVPVKVVVEYPEGSDLPDGEMEIEFNSIELTFKTIDKATPLVNPTINPSAGTSFCFINVKKEEFETIQMVDYTIVPSNAIESCDASSTGDESIMMWYRDMDKNGLYEMYIGSVSKITVNNASNMFSDYTNVFSMDLKNLTTSETTNMSYMFANDKSLQKLNLDHFDGSSVTTMQGMFQSTSVNELKLNNFNAPNLSNINYMFRWADIKKIEMNNFTAGEVTSTFRWKSYAGVADLGLTNAEEISMRNLNLPKVTDASYMFYNLLKLIKLDITGINAPNIENMQYMFGNLETIASIIGIGDLRTSKAINMSNMFSNNYRLNQLNLSNVNNMFKWADIKKIEMNNFTGGEVTSMVRWKSYAGIFDLGLTNAEEISMRNLNLPKVTDASYMFYYLPKLTKLDITGINAPNIENMRDMFSNLKILTKITGLEDLETNNVINMSYMFGYDNKIENLDVSNFNTSKVTDMQHMFDSCQSITKLDLSNFDTKNVKNMSWMFSSSTSLEELIIDNFDGSSVTTMEAMFQSTNITDFILNDFNAPNLSNVNNMFRWADIKKIEMNNFTGGEVTSTFSWKSYAGVADLGLTNAEEISMRNLNLPKVTDASYMFYYLPKLTKLDITGINAPNIENMQYMFGNLETIASIIGIEDLRTSKAINMSNMFSNNYRLNQLNLSNFNTSNVIIMERMFDNCNVLEVLDISSFDTSKVTNMNYMFTNNKALRNLDLDHFNGSSVTTLQGMFYGVVTPKIKLNNFNAPNLNNINYMFREADIQKLEMNNFTGGEVTSTFRWKSYAGVANLGLTNAEEISMINLNLPKVTDASYMFCYLPKLTKLDISGINIPLIENTSNMFNDCSKISSLDLSTFDMANVTNSSYMFSGVPKSINLSLKDTPANHSFYITDLFDFTNVSWS